MPKRSKLARKAKVTDAEPAPRKKRRSSVKRRGRNLMARRRKQGRMGAGWLPNPADVDWVETGKMLGIGFGAFAATKFLSRTVTVQVAKRKPTWAKHVGALSSLAAVAAALLAAKRWKKTAPYQTELLWGTGLAALQNLLNTYLPKLGWIANDTTPDQIAEASAPKQLAAQATSGLLDDDDDDEEIFDRAGGRWDAYNDATNRGRFSRAAARDPHATPPPNIPPKPAAGPGGLEKGDDELDDVLVDFDGEDDELAGGSLAPN